MISEIETIGLAFLLLGTAVTGLYLFFLYRAYEGNERSKVFYRETMAEWNGLRKQGAK